MFQDAFLTSVDSPSAPAELYFAVTPDDHGLLPRATWAVYVGVGGGIALVPVCGNDPVIFRIVPSAVIVDVGVKAVRLTGTTAAYIIGLA